MREVQFLIERECPTEYPNGTQLEEPFAVWIEWNPQQQTAVLERPCGSIAFRVTQPHERFVDFYDGDAWVCEHMGRVIE